MQKTKAEQRSETPEICLHTRPFISWLAWWPCCEVESRDGCRWASSSQLVSKSTKGIQSWGYWDSTVDSAQGEIPRKQYLTFVLWILTFLNDKNKLKNYKNYLIDHKITALQILITFVKLMLYEQLSYIWPMMHKQRHHLKRAHESLIHAHHSTSIVKLPTIVGCWEQSDKLPLCKKFIAILNDLRVR